MLKEAAVIYSHRLVNASNLDFGTVGEPTNVYGINVGDLAACLHKEKIVTGLVAKHGDKSFLIGLKEYNLKELDKLTTIIPYPYVTEEYLYEEYGLKLVAQRKMSKQQIEESLGFPVEIVD